MANKAVGQKLGGQELVGGLDCTVHRNFFGSQIQSFETEVEVPEIADKEGGPPTFRGVFIRAPAVLEVGPDVQVLAAIPVSSLATISVSALALQLNSMGLVDSISSVIVAVKQGNLLGTAFHPELTADTRWHSYFLKMADEYDGEEGTSNGEELNSLSYQQKQLKPELPIFETRRTLV